LALSTGKRRRQRTRVTAVVKLTCAGFPTPVPTEAGPMPTDKGLGPDDRHGLEDRRKPAIQLNEGKRSLFVKWTRPRPRRCRTISCCRSRAFSASSRLFDLNGEANSVNKKHSSATIVADVKRFCHWIKRTKFSAHTSMTETTYVQQLRKAISGEFLFWGNVPSNQATDCDLA
jgi:hypothetical protein